VRPSAQRDCLTAQRDGRSRSHNDHATSCTPAATGLAFERCPGQHIAVVPTARNPDVEEHMRNGARGLVLSGGIAACLVIAGCGGSSNSSTPSASSAATSDAPAPAATSDAPAPATTSDAPAPATTSDAPAASGGKVGILLPDTQSSNRWVTSDPIALKANCAKYKLTCDIQNANNDPARMVTIAQSMMNNGAKLLLVTPLDPASAGKIETAAKAAGVITIDYDRLASGGSASLYVSFDNTKVGELQGQALTQCSQVKGKSAVSYVDINGSKTDNNATLFKGGYDSVLSKAAGWTKKDDQWIAEWNNQQAGVTFASMLQSNPSLNAVMVANDGMAGSVIAGLKKQKLNGKVAVSGQDATVAGMQAVLNGDQCFTIYKPSTGEADPAIKAAAALLAGNAPETTQTIKDPVSGREVPAILATPVVITKANVNVPIADGYAPKAQVCAGSFAALCTSAGVK